MVEIVEEKSPVEHIADTYGLFHQELQLIQEMAELMQALTKSMLNIGTEQIKMNVQEETADVENVLEQVKYLRGDREAVERIKAQKIERQLRRIAEVSNDDKWKEMIQYLRSKMEDNHGSKVH